MAATKFDRDPNARQIMRTLSRDGYRILPRTKEGPLLDEMVSAGWVEAQTDGIRRSYRLTLKAKL